MTFANKLKAERERAGLTQQQLADKIGIFREAVARLEAGKREPGWSTVQALAKALGVECGAFQDDAPKGHAKKLAPAKGKSGQKRTPVRGKPT